MAEYCGLMAVETVYCELVSTPISLLNRENTGKFYEFHPNQPIYAL
jgi:hypothetical protein